MPLHLHHFRAATRNTLWLKTGLTDWTSHFQLIVDAADSRSLRRRGTGRLTLTHSRNFSAQSGRAVVETNFNVVADKSNLRQRCGNLIGHSCVILSGSWRFAADSLDRVA